MTVYYEFIIIVYKFLNRVNTIVIKTTFHKLLILTVNSTRQSSINAIADKLKSNKNMVSCKSTSWRNFQVENSMFHHNTLNNYNAKRSIPKLIKLD